MGRKTIVKDLDTGQIFDSRDEMYISWYLEELKQHGFVEKWKFEPKSFTLGEGVEKIRRVNYEQLVTKVTQKISLPMLLQEHVYTPDFMVRLTDKAQWLFFNNHNEVISTTIPFILYNSMVAILEVKPEKNSKWQGSKPKTTISRKWLLDKEGKFCQQISYKELFFRSFAPKRYLNKDHGRKRYNIDKKYITIDRYLEIRNKLNKEYFSLKNKYIQQ